MYSRQNFARFVGVATSVRPVLRQINSKNPPLKTTGKSQHTLCIVFASTSKTVKLCLNDGSGANNFFFLIFLIPFLYVCKKNKPIESSGLASKQFCVFFFILGYSFIDSFRMQLNVIMQYPCSCTGVLTFR